MMVFHRIMNIVSCAIQQDLVFYPFSIEQFASVNTKLLTNPSPSPCLATTSQVCFLCTYFYPPVFGHKVGLFSGLFWVDGTTNPLLTNKLRVVMLYIIFGFGILISIQGSQQHCFCLCRMTLIVQQWLPHQLGSKMSSVSVNHDSHET